MPDLFITRRGKSLSLILLIYDVAIRQKTRNIKDKDFPLRVQNKSGSNYKEKEGEYIVVYLSLQMLWMLLMLDGYKFSVVYFYAYVILPFNRNCCVIVVLIFLSYDILMLLFLC